MTDPSPLDHCYDAATNPWEGDDQEDLDVYRIWTALFRFRNGEPYWDAGDNPDNLIGDVQKGQSFVCTLQRLYNSIRSGNDDLAEATHCRGFRLGQQGQWVNRDGIVTPLPYCHELSCPTCWVAAFKEICRLLAGLTVPQIQLRYTDVLPVTRSIDAEIRSAVQGKGKGQRWSPLCTQVVIGVDPADKYEQPGLRYVGLFVPDPARKDMPPAELRGWQCTSQKDGDEAFHTKTATTPSGPVGLHCRTLIDNSDLHISTRAIEAWLHIAFPPPLLFRWPAFSDLDTVVSWINQAERSSRGPGDNQHRVGFQVPTAEAYGGNAGDPGEFEVFRDGQDPDWLNCIDTTCEVGQGYDRPDPSEWTDEVARDIPPETRLHDRHPFHIPWLDQLFPDHAGPIWGSGAAIIGQQGGGKTTLSLLMCIAQAAHGRPASYYFHGTEQPARLRRVAASIHASYRAMMVAHGLGDSLRSEAETMQFLTLAPVSTQDSHVDFDPIIELLAYASQPRFVVIDDLNGLVFLHLRLAGSDTSLMGATKADVARRFAWAAEPSDSFVVLADQLKPERIGNTPFGINISDADADGAPRLCESLRYCFALGPLKSGDLNLRSFGIPRTLDDHRVVGDDRLILATSEGPYIDVHPHYHLDGCRLKAGPRPNQDA